MFWTHVSEAAVRRVTDVLRSGWLNEGAVVKDFEARLGEVLGLRNAVAVNSGTSALHLALHLCGVGPGDEVVLPAQTFVATGTVVLMQGATPVFADIEPATGNLSARSVAERLGDRTRAVVAVHWGGLPCDMDAINELAAGRGIAVIEDAAHALGATYKGRPTGSVSRFTAFSFQSIKHLTTGDGGCLCCLDERDATRAVAARWFGIDRARARPNAEGARLWDIQELGYKYHMNNVAAALGLGNLEDFPERLARRRRVATAYRAELAGVPGLELLELPSDREHAYWLFTLRVENRDGFVKKLADRGIRSSVVDLGIDRNSLFEKYRCDLPGQREFDLTQISIPVHEGLSDEQVARVIQAIRSGW